MADDGYQRIYISRKIKSSGNKKLFLIGGEMSRVSFCVIVEQLLKVISRLVFNYVKFGQICLCFLHLKSLIMHEKNTSCPEAGPAFLIWKTLNGLFLGSSHCTVVLYLVLSCSVCLSLDR